MEKKIKVAAVGDNCVDAYDQTGEAFPGGNPVNVAVLCHVPVLHTHMVPGYKPLPTQW